MRHTILLIGDDVNQRIINETLLELRGHEVVSVGSASEAREVLLRRPIAVAVVDLDGANGVGIEGLRQVQQAVDTLPFGEPPRLVATTTRSEPDLERFARHAGAAAFFRKPVPPRHFLDTIDRFAAPTAGGRFARRY